MRRVLAATMAVLLVGCFTTTSTSVSGLTIEDPRIGRPAAENAALYLTIRSTGGDRLLGARTNVAVAAELHETTHADDGSMGMRQVEALDVPPGEPLVLEPGGLHIMLIDVADLAEGDTVPVTLFFEQMGEVEVQATVVDPAETMSEDMHHDH